MDSGKMKFGRPVAARKKRINDYLRIAMYATAAAITTTFQWGCIKEDHGSYSDTSGDGVAVYISMDVPGTADTRAMTVTDENTIKTLDVLVFLDNGVGQDETFLYSTHATDFAPSGATTTVKVGLQKSNATDKHRLVFLANLRDEITTVKGSWTTAMTKEQVLQSVTFDAYGAAETDETKRVWDTSQPDPRFLPMWGESDGTYVVTSTLMGSTIGTIKMLRSVATVNIILNPDPQGDPQGFPNFKLKDIKVYNVPQKGYAAPEPDNLASMVAEFPTYSSTFSRNASTVVAYGTNTTLQEDIYGFTKQIYIPEAPNTDGDPLTPANINDLDQTCLVISGYYDGSLTETWYRLDFIDKLSLTENLRRDILRNHRYTFYITSVDGAGYDTEEEAFKSLPFNLQYQILDWNGEDMDDVWFVGNYYYSITPLNAELWAQAYINSKIMFKTDYHTWSFELSDLPTPNDPAKNLANIDWLDITSHTPDTEYAGIPTGDDILYNVTLNTSGGNRVAYLHYTSGRFKVTGTITQTMRGLTSIVISPSGQDIPSEGAVRTITATGDYGDIMVIAKDKDTDEIFAAATIPASITSSTANITVPQYWFADDPTVMTTRDVIFQYLPSGATQFIDLETQKQESCFINIYCTNVTLTAAGYFPHSFTRGDQAMIEAWGNIPGVLLRFYNHDDGNATQGSYITAGSYSISDPAFGYAENLHNSKFEPVQISLQYSTDNGVVWHDIKTGMQDRYTFDDGYILAKDYTMKDGTAGLEEMTWAEAMGIELKYNYEQFWGSPNGGSDELNIGYPATETTGCGAYWEVSPTHTKYGVGQWQLACYINNLSTLRSREWLRAFPFADGIQGIDAEYSVWVADEHNMGAGIIGEYALQLTAYWSEITGTGRWAYWTQGSGVRDKSSSRYARCMLKP